MSIVSKEEYWTTILNDYSQFGQITTEDSEFNSIANDVWNVLENSFIKIDDEESIIKWEEMTGLSGEGLTIFQRKVNILYTLTVKNYLPIGLFTQAMVRLVGEDNYIITFNEDTQKYEVECYEDYGTSASFLNKRLANESVELEITPLPSGYLAADFLESTGTQYINTKWSPFSELHENVASGFRVDGVMLSTTNWKLVAGTARNSGGFIFGTPVRTGIDTLNINFGTKYFETPIGSASWVNSRFVHELNYKNSRISNLYTYAGVVTHDLTTVNNNLFITSRPFILFGSSNEYQAGAYLIACRIWRAECSEAYKVIRNFIPALDPTGIPCMFDLVSKQPFQNAGSGQFIVGMNMQQARKFSKLPTIGGTLTVSLPSNYTEDEDVVNSLSTAQENGWVITIQTYETEASAASTFALRRVWVRKTQNEQGSYVDSDGSRWQVDWCVDIVGSSPEAEGYELFRSVDTAIEYWGLTAWIDPEQEELLINDFTEND